MWHSYLLIIAIVVAGGVRADVQQYAPQSSQAYAAAAAAATGQLESYGAPSGPSSAPSAPASPADMSQYVAANNLYPSAAAAASSSAQYAPSASASDVYYTQNDGQYHATGAGGDDHQNYQVRYTFIPTYIYRNRVIHHPALSQAIENPSYDPNLYQTFVPQESVQQYVNSYGGPYPPNNGGGGVNGGIELIDVSAAPGGGIPIINGGGGGGIGPIGGGGGGPIGGPYALGPYGFPLGAGPPGGFSVQSGFEGFLVPHVPGPPPPPPPPPYSIGPGPFDLLRAIIPQSIASIFMRSGGFLLQSIGVILFGGAVTTAICSMTPLCTISFAALPLLGLRDGATKAVTDALSKEVTTDRVARAAAFVQNAIAKYQQLQLTHVESSGGDARKADAKATETTAAKQLPLASVADNNKDN